MMNVLRDLRKNKVPNLRTVGWVAATAETQRLVWRMLGYGYA